jgi:hypothetical protein
MLNILLIALLLLPATFMTAQENDTLKVDVFVREVDNYVNEFEEILLNNILKVHNSKNDIKVKVNIIKKPFNDIRPYMLKHKNDIKYMFSIAAYTISDLPDFEYSAAYLPVRDSFIGLKHYSEPVNRRINLGYIDNKYNLAVLNTVQDKNKYKFIPYTGYNEIRRAYEKGAIDLYFADSYKTYFNPEIKIEKYISKTKFLGIIFLKNSKIKEILDPTINYYLRSPGYHKLLKKILGDGVSEYISKTLKGIE